MIHRCNPEGITVPVFIIAGVSGFVKRMDLERITEIPVINSFVIGSSDFAMSMCRPNEKRLTAMGMARQLPDDIYMVFFLPSSIFASVSFRISSRSAVSQPEKVTVSNA